MNNIKMVVSEQENKENLKLMQKPVSCGLTQVKEFHKHDACYVLIIVFIWIFAHSVSLFFVVVRVLHSRH